MYVAYSTYMHKIDGFLCVGACNFIHAQKSLFGSKMYAQLVAIS